MSSDRRTRRLQRLVARLRKGAEDLPEDHDELWAEARAAIQRSEEILAQDRPPER
jgi:hypothetical protein